MSLLVTKNRTALPALVSDFFNTERFFPSLTDLEANLFDFNGGALSIPNANIVENETDYSIELAAPGLERKDFKVEVENGILSISAQKEEEKKEETKTYRRKEFSYNSFCRTFTLPENSLSDKIDAKYQNGILHLSIPKKEITISKPAKEIKVS